MAKIFPFCGILYNKKKIKSLSKVISPPYDVISSSKQDFLYDLSDFNVIRLVLGKDYIGDNEYNNRYVRACASFEGWLRHGILLRDEKPAIYIYEQQFKHKSKTYSRMGIVSLITLEDLGKGKIYPHEYTLSKPKFDRIELLRTTSANFDCVFSLFSDEKSKVSKLMKKLSRRKPDLEAKDMDGCTNRLWKINQKSVLKWLQKEFKDKSVFIADGHHRYEAALQYRNEMKLRNTRYTEEEPYNYVMMYFTPIENNGLVVLPIHRMVKVLPNLDTGHALSQLGVYFEIEEFTFSKRTEEKTRKRLVSSLSKNRGKHSFGIYFKEKPLNYYLLSLKNESIMNDVIEGDKPLAWKTLDVTILHKLVFERIFDLHEEENFVFTKDENEALDGVKNGEFSMSVILNPTKIEDIITIAGKFERMPQKSTYFYPKLTTGIIMNKIIQGEKIE